MKSKFTVEIPYFSRNKYKDFVRQVNEIVEESGYCAFFISNIIPHLKSYLVIETNKYGLQIESLINEYGLSNDTSRGSKEFFIEMGTRQWDVIAINRTYDTDSLFKLYAFADEATLEAKGYKFEPIQKKMLFISYCHNDAISFMKS